LPPAGAFCGPTDQRPARGAFDRPRSWVHLPNGNIATTHDWHHRVAVIDQASKQITWQYGRDGSPGSAPGYLRKPDGLDLLS
jgi:hypothetical protein